MSSTRWLEECELPFASCSTINDNWVRVDGDIRETVSLPCEFSGVKAGEAVVLEKVLPSIITDKDYFCTRALKQNMKVYVGDELRLDFHQTFEYFYWEEVTHRIIFVPIYAEDAGKILRIEATAINDTVRHFNNAYVGEKVGIEMTLFKNNAPQFIFGILFAIFGVVFLTLGIVLRILTKGLSKAGYMGGTMLLVAIWTITYNEMRDILFANVIAINAVPMIMLILIPMMLALYMNALQGDRYRKWYLCYFFLATCHALTCLAYALMRIRSFTEDLLGLLSFIVLLFIMFTIFTIIDIRKKYAKEYRIVLWGIAVLTLMGLHQIIAYFVKYDTNGLYFLIGFGCLTVMAFVHDFIKLIKLEEEKRQAEFTADIKSQFLATMSHEIRTPINAVLGMNEAILRESKESNVIGYATDVDQAGRLLLSLINDILDFSKLDSGKMELVPVEYSLKSLVTSCYNLVEKRALEKNLKFVIDVDENLPSELCGDEVRIQQIITNLLTNAIKYTKEGRVGLKIYGEAASEDRINLKIHVSDTGIGIKQEDIGKLFNPFSRVDQKNNINIQGTGLGLAITKQLVTAMNGQISVVSTYGSGSVFTVSLPQTIVNSKAVGKVSMEHTEENRKKRGKEQLITAPDASILVVDDVVVNLKVVQSLLKKTGIKVDTSISGDDCLEMVKRKKYDVIFLDHMMPVKDGIQTLHEMREMPECINKDTPVIMLTANAISGAREEYMAEGFSDYMTKPFSIAELNKMLLKYIPEEKIGGDVSEKVEAENAEMIRKIEENEKAKETATIPVYLDEVIDRKVALSNCNNDEAELKERIEQYLLDDKRALLSECFDRKDIDNYRMLVRSIRSSSNSIGALKLVAKALEVEQQIDNPTGPPLIEIHRELCTMYSRAINVLTKFKE